VRNVDLTMALTKQGPNPPTRVEENSRVRQPVSALRRALARADGKFIYSPGFIVDCADTTGAGDVFHGAFCYSVLKGMSLRDSLEFSNAMAALNCTRLGARGGIATAAEARALMERGQRRSHADFAS